MGEFEQYTHEQLAGLLAGADPEQLTARADVLVAMARALNGADKQVFVQMSQVEWQGESAEAFRSWGRHLVQESAVLADYARTVGNALQDAGQALSEARAAMPPTPERRAPVSEAAIASVSEELERQEAIHVLERLSSSYRAAADDMATAQEPRFRPLPGVDERRGGKESGGSSSTPAESAPWPRQGARDATAGGMAPTSGHESHRASQVDSPVEGQRATGGIASPRGTADERTGTSLDSTAPVSQPQLASVEPLPTTGRPNTADSGSGEFPVRLPQSGTAGLFLRPRGLPEGHATGPRSPGAGRPVVDVGHGGRGDSRSPAGRAGGEAIPVAPGVSDERGPAAGRPPTQSGLETSSAAPSRGTQSPSGGIIGGIPQRPPGAGSGLPPSTAIGAQRAMAYRDPLTGLVHGPGGVPIMKRAGEASSRPPRTSEQSGRGSQTAGLPSRRGGRRSNPSADEGHGETRERNG